MKALAALVAAVVAPLGQVQALDQSKEINNSSYLHL